MSTDKLAIIAVTERGRDLAITLTKTVANLRFLYQKSIALSKRIL